MCAPRIPGTISLGRAGILQSVRSNNPSDWRMQNAECRMQNAECRTKFCICILHWLAARSDATLSVVRHQVEPSIAPIDGPAGSLVAAQETLLIQLGVGPRTVELVAAVNHRAEEMARLPAKPAHHLLQRGDKVHTFGNQRHRWRPDVVVERSHHDLRLIP